MSHMYYLCLSDYLIPFAQEAWPSEPYSVLSNAVQCPEVQVQVKTFDSLNVQGLKLWLEQRVRLVAPLAVRTRLV